MFFSFLREHYLTKIYTFFSKYPFLTEDEGVGYQIKKTHSILLSSFRNTIVYYLHILNLKNVNFQLFCNLLTNVDFEKKIFHKKLSNPQEGFRKVPLKSSISCRVKGEYLFSHSHSTFTPNVQVFQIRILTPEIIFW